MYTNHSFDDNSNTSDQCSSVSVVFDDYEDYICDIEIGNNFSSDSLSVNESDSSIIKSSSSCNDRSNSNRNSSGSSSCVEVLSITGMNDMNSSNRVNDSNDSQSCASLNSDSNSRSNNSHSITQEINQLLYNEYYNLRISTYDTSHNSNIIANNENESFPFITMTPNINTSPLELDNIETKPPVTNLLSIFQMDEDSSNLLSEYLRNEETKTILERNTGIVSRIDISRESLLSLFDCDKKVNWIRGEIIDYFGTFFSSYMNKECTNENVPRHIHVFSNQFYQILTRNQEL